MQLALGTVQFGLRYGVAGRGMAVPEEEARGILAHAASLGIRWLDTASAYGDIEQRLAGLCAPDQFNIVTKLPPLPEGMGVGDVDAWLAAALQRAHDRLGSSLRALMFHRADDLLSRLGDRLWTRSTEWAQSHACQLGVSCYDTTTLNTIAARYPVALAQLPGNALDQRLRTEPVQPPGIEVHLRSAFLQGLLLMPEAQAARRVPAAAGALAHWHAWCREQALQPLVAALGVIKTLPGVTHCVVGVDDLTQLKAIEAAWRIAPPLQAPHLQTHELAVIDPRCWPQV